MPKKKGPPVNRATKPKNYQAPRPRPRNNNNNSRFANGSTVVMAPAALAAKRRVYFIVQSANTKYKEAIRIKGQDYVSTVQGNGETTGVSILNQPVNPLYGVFAGTRLSHFAELYDKYCFNDLKFHYSPACGSSTSGSIVMAYDRDPTDGTPPASDHGLQQYFGMMGAQSTVVWDSMTVSAPRSDPQDFYYANKGSTSDERLTDQGQIYIAAATLLPVGPIGNLWVEYDITLFDPQLEDNDAIEAARDDNVNVSTVAKTGFNGIAVTQSIGKQISQHVDTDGNTFFRFLPGTYSLLYEWLTSSASTSATLSPYVAGVLNTGILNTLSVFAGASGTRNAIMKVPKEGADVYAAFTTASTGNVMDRRFWAYAAAPESFELLPN